MVSTTPRPLYPQGKIPRYPLDSRLYGLQCRSGRGGEEKNYQPLPGLEPPITQPVAPDWTTPSHEGKKRHLQKKGEKKRICWGGGRKKHL
jgi:hypothetical protein